MFFLINAYINNVWLKLLLQFQRCQNEIMTLLTTMYCRFAKHTLHKKWTRQRRVKIVGPVTILFFYFTKNTYSERFDKFFIVQQCMWVSVPFNDKFSSDLAPLTFFIYIYSCSLMWRLPLRSIWNIHVSKLP